MLEPGSTIGIMGGGQLGRMLAIAAAELGFKTHVYAPDTDSPAFEVAGRFTLAAYDDKVALETFANSVAVATFEFENIPVATIEAIEDISPVFPSSRALGLTQDRLIEKNFMRHCGVMTAPFAEVRDLASLNAAIQMVGTPAILKTRRFGYDGKGQMKIMQPNDAAAAFSEIKSAPAVLEGFVPFTKEISVIAARNTDGAFSAFDISENEHKNHILDRTVVPATLSQQAADQALAAARALAEGLGYVGVFAVEFFVVVENGIERVIGNEIAPRVHNSGHWTLHGAHTSQFEQHIRAIAGWPFGSNSRHGRIEMLNLVGENTARWRELAGEPNTRLQLYGKSELRAGRKMGHATRIFDE